MMLRPAFSTVAVPDWTLDRVARSASRLGFQAVELRSFGAGSTRLACDPALTAREKVRKLFGEHGVRIAGVSTGVRLDAAVFPPVVGQLMSARHQPVRDGRHAVEVAHDVGATYASLFAFEVGGRERHRAVLRRVCERLALVCDHARHRDLVVVIENGGDFATADDLREIHDYVASPLLRVCYDISTAAAAGEDPVEGVRSIAPLVHAVRVRDMRHGAPCALGSGDVPVRAALDALGSVGSDAWVVYNWDRLWLSDLAGADSVLPGAAETLYEWIGAGAGSHAAA
ncbi:MAG: sugar phosphate isomerase/epimerase [Phycisphaerales bacterium]|nr:sugar phosphate isomerase/epimerase [Phycisphaerales bacterium]